MTLHDAQRALAQVNTELDLVGNALITRPDDFAASAESLQEIAQLLAKLRFSADFPSGEPALAALLRETAENARRVHALFESAAQFHLGLMSAGHATLHEYGLDGAACHSPLTSVSYACQLEA